MVLAEMGLKVWGMDLSSNSIQQAEVARKELGYANLEFCVHDMRQPYPVTGLSAVFNLFTSFGYFDDALDDTQALVNMHSSLKEGGYLVQDYLNATPLLNNSKGNSLQELTWSEISGVRFGTEKWFENGTIFKRILVSDHRENQGGNVENQGIYGGYFQGTGGLLEFREEVKVYSLHDLINLHTSAGFAIESVHGSYDLMPFSEENSPRMIVVSKKI
jgi:SAM-dependent methyltransferase